MEPRHKQDDVIDGRYRIAGVLGQGGVGTTYEAESLKDGSRVALKELWLWHRHDWKVLELFEREARVLAALSHPMVPRYVESFQVETPEGPCFYLAQELAHGRSLAEWIARGWQPSELEVRAIADALLGVLEHLQRLVPPVIHRDVTPANVIRSDEGELRLVDFGAVRDTLRTLAAGSTVVGTFAYMAPEQLHGQALPATDLYGLGTTLVFLLTRTSPLSLPRRRGRLDWRGRARVSAPFAAFVDKLIQPVVEDRFQNALQARLALRNVGQTSRSSLARVLLALGLCVAAVGAIAAAVAWPLSHTRPTLPPASRATARPLDRRVPSQRLRFVRAFIGQLAPVMTVAWLPDGKELVSGDMSGAVRLWDVATGKEIRAFGGHTGRVSEVAVTPNGRKIVSGSFDATVRVWDVRTGKQVEMFAEHRAPVSTVAVSRDGRLVASGDGNGKIVIQELATGRVLFTTSQPPRLNSVAFGSGTLLASGGDDGPVRVWNASTGKLEGVLRGHRGAVDRVAFTPDGQTLVSSGDDHTVRVWTIGVSRLARTIRDHTDEVWALSLSRDGKLAASSGKDGMLVVDSVFTSELVARREHADERQIPAVAFSPDGKLIAVAGASYLLRLWALVPHTWQPHWVDAPVPHVDKKPPPGLSKAELLCFQAEKLLGSEANVGPAKPLLDAALKLDPRCARAYADLGRLAYRLGYISYWNYEPSSLTRAHQFFDRAFALSPNLYRAHLYDAYAYLFQKDYDKATRQAALAENSKPNDPRTQALYISLGERQHNDDGILVHARALIDTSNDPVVLGSAYEGLVRVYEARGEWDAADHCYRSEINLDPTSAWAKGNYAAFLVLRGEFDRAIAMSKLALSQLNYGMGHVTLADAYAGKALQILRRGGDKHEAKKLIDQALETSGSSAAARYARGAYEQQNGDTAAAKRDYQAALVIDPHYELAERALGR
jgi:WD40 repeat protein/serine/threonine protein kinase/tetratricopeptide (TPR) repeat protein